MATLAIVGTCFLHDSHTEALVQYPKYLAAIVAQPKGGSVPTTAIDLAWRMHQLTPAIYARQTLLLMGRVVNRDDSDDVASEARIAEGAKSMAGMWRALYDEEYFAPAIPRTAATDFRAKVLDMSMTLAHIPTGGALACATTQAARCGRALRCMVPSPGLPGLGLRS
ncbi:hypothetical protein GGF32_004159 [Allomyces javanicus]|nr:hypothetical protein GGF32_004159 [Allomyces javanicus]